MLVAEFVRLLEEKDRLEILAAAESVRDPLPRLARVIEIKHRRDRIHAQAVDVIFVEPEERVGDEEIAHFVAAEIENQRAPILVLALPRIGVFVEIRAVKLREGMRVLRKMRRHPIHDHADAGAMAAIDEMPELVRRSEAAGRRVIVRDLITPRAFERMLGDREQLDVGEAHLEHVRQQRLRKLEIAEEAIPLLHHAPPRAEMHLVNADRAAMPLLLRALRHPLVVAPLVALEVVNQRRGLRAVLTEKPERIALQQERAGLAS